MAKLRKIRRIIKSMIHILDNKLDKLALQELQMGFFAFSVCVEPILETVFFYHNSETSSARNIAIPKLNRVPTNTYSDCLVLRKRRMDLAAMISPTALY